VWTAYTAATDMTALPYRLWLPEYAGWFATGIALALVTVADPAWRPARMARELAASLPTCWVAAGALFWIVTGPLAGPVNLSLVTTPGQMVVRNVLYQFIAGLVVLPLVLGDQRTGAVRRWLSAPPVRFLGEASYGLFLVHAVLIEAAYGLFGWRPFTGSLILVTAGIWTSGMAIASLIYVLVERPLQRWRTLVPDRLPAERAPTTTADRATTASV
jgi:peptidoglycan/LPS O-acetylase OafA/YrhL